MASSFSSNAFLGASLYQVWSVLNFQQIIVHAPIYGSLKLPAIVLIFNEIMLTLAAFKFIDTGKHVDPNLFYLPETDPFSQSFEECDYESTLLLSNSSSTIWIYTLHVTMMILTTIVICFANKLCKSWCV